MIKSKLKIHNNIDHFNSKGTVITIGTFDGVHLGHQKVIEQINSIAQNMQAESLLFSFSQHPRLVVSSDHSIRFITTVEEKIERLKQTNIEHLVVYPFSLEFASLSYIQFIDNILINRLNMKALVIGHDHRLGKNREGNFENLLQLSAEKGFSLHRIEPFLLNDTRISSSKIRHALQEGNIKKANLFLGYQFMLTGKVISGNQLGRKIGFPTANLVADNVHKLVPATGVYAVYALVNGNRFKGMLNIGYRPTISQQADHRTIEVHIFDFDEDIYDQVITLLFVARIRDEFKFETIHVLKNQLEKDKIVALQLL